MASSSRSFAVSARSVSSVRSVSSRAASSSARSRSVSCASAVIVLSASSRAVASFSRTSVVAARSAASRSSASTFAVLQLFAGGRQLLVADREIGGDALELLLGGGQRLLRLGQLAAQGLGLRLALGERRVGLLAQADQLGVALGQRRLGRLAAQAFLVQPLERLVGLGAAAPPRRREVDHEPATDLEDDGADRVGILVAGERRPPLAGAGELPARERGQPLAMAARLDGEHGPTEPPALEPAPAADDLEPPRLAPAEALELERDVADVGHQPSACFSSAGSIASPWCPAGGRARPVAALDSGGSNAEAMVGAGRARDVAHADREAAFGASQGSH